MKRHIFIMLALGMLACAANAQTTNASTNTAPKTDFTKIFKTDKEKYSYAIGMFWAAGVKSRLQAQSLEYDPDVMTKAFGEALAGGNTVITEAQEREILNDLNSQ